MYIVHRCKREKKNEDKKKKSGSNGPLICVYL